MGLGRAALPHCAMPSQAVMKRISTTAGGSPALHALPLILQEDNSIQKPPTDHQGGQGRPRFLLSHYHIVMKTTTPSRHGLAQLSLIIEAS